MVSNGRRAEQNLTEWQQQFADNYWLGLGDVSKIRTVNPFDMMTQEEKENPHLFLLKLYQCPEYFSLMCRHIFNVDLHPFQMAILMELWKRPFPMLIGSRGMGKTWIIALYLMIRALFQQGTKGVVCGAAFRQSKFVFNYCREFWDKAPVLRSIVGKGSQGRWNGPRQEVDRCSLRIGDSILSFLPIGTGDKIRGERANVTVGEEFASIPVEIWEVVIRGFGIVSKDPVLKAKYEARLEALRQLGIQPNMEELEEQAAKGNQTIINGTAYYGFNHFADYHAKYKAYIETGGNVDKLTEIFGSKPPDDFHYDHYGIIRMPATLLPRGFMDIAQIANAKATMSHSRYLMELGAVFVNDSDGFYKRSALENCTVSFAKPIYKQGEEIKFSAKLRGNPECDYVFGVDPAYEGDNLSIVVLEIWPTHRRILHVWTTNRERHRAKIARGITEEKDYFRFAARKIRDLKRIFPAKRIAIDTQGGGKAIFEVLADDTNLQPGESPLLFVVDPDKPRDEDAWPGEHIIVPINFASADWVSGANFGMQLDFEKQELLFPAMDPVEIGLAMEEDKMSGRIKIKGPDDDIEGLYDTLEDCMWEIDELKDELCSIVHTQTGKQLRDHFDTPEVKMEGGKKGRQRKDRYSALLMANMVAREWKTVDRTPMNQTGGGFAHQMKGKVEGPVYAGGPEWWTNGASDAILNMYGGQG